MPRMMERLVDNLCLRVRLIGHRVSTSTQGSHGSHSSHYFADTYKQYISVCGGQSATTEFLLINIHT